MEYDQPRVSHADFKTSTRITFGLRTNLEDSNLDIAILFHILSQYPIFLLRTSMFCFHPNSIHDFHEH